MSHRINYSKNKVIVVFDSDVDENEIKQTFLEVVENVNIKKLKSIIFDYTNVTSYNVIPAKFVKTVKTYTQFSTEWNKNINAIAVATNKNVKAVNRELAKHKNELVWNYLLFESLDNALKWCEKN